MTQLEILHLASDTAIGRWLYYEDIRKAAEAAGTPNNIASYMEQRYKSKYEEIRKMIENEEVAK